MTDQAQLAERLRELRARGGMPRCPHGVILCPDCINGPGEDHPEQIWYIPEDASSAPYIRLDLYERLRAALLEILDARFSSTSHVRVVARMVSIAEQALLAEQDAKRQGEE